jgi:drug/metabolite transporter (DMT)-like permease
MASPALTVAEAHGQHRRGQAYVALAAVAWSTAGLLQRELSFGTTTQVAGRALFALLALLAYVAVSHRAGLVDAFRSVGRAGVAVAVCMAIASGSFIIALNHTSVAHVLFIQAVAPVVAALLGSVVLAEPVSARTWAAMLVALAGVGLMIGTPGGGSALGDGMSLVMTFAFAVAIVITRHRRDVSMAPATCLAQLLLVIVAAPFAHPGAVGGRDLVLLMLIGVGQMALAMALFTIGARLIPAAEVALISLLEVVLGPLWVWLALSEQPDAATLIGGGVVVAAVAMQAGRSVQRGVPAGRPATAEATDGDGAAYSAPPVP